MPSSVWIGRGVIQFAIQRGRSRNYRGSLPVTRFFDLWASLFSAVGTVGYRGLVQRWIARPIRCRRPIRVSQIRSFGSYQVAVRSGSLVLLQVENKDTTLVRCYSRLSVEEYQVAITRILFLFHSLRNSNSWKPWRFNPEYTCFKKI